MTVDDFFRKVLEGPVVSAFPINCKLADVLCLLDESGEEKCSVLAAMLRARLMAFLIPKDLSSEEVLNLSRQLDEMLNLGISK